MGGSRSMDGSFSAIDVTVEPRPALTDPSGAPNRRSFTGRQHERAFFTEITNPTASVCRHLSSGIYRTIALVPGEPLQRGGCSRINTRSVMKEWPGVDVNARLKLISLRRWSMSAVKEPQARVHVPASSNQALSFVGKVSA